MKKLWFFLLLALLAANRAMARDSYALEKKDMVERVFRMAAAAQPPVVKVDNVIGSITVSGVPGSQVRLTLKKTLRADTPEWLARAESEVRLDVSEKDGRLELYVDGPFRHREGRHHEGDRKYDAVYDFELQVPERCDLVLNTVTGGDVRVRGVSGAFSVRNVNGRVELEGIAGSGSGQTVNGDVRAAFRAAPGQPCSFKTVNGDVEVRLAPGLAADFKVKTFNGGVYSDLPVSYVPGSGDKPRHEKGRFVYRSHGFQGVRVGTGGAEITLDTLNGDIVIAGAKSN
jgi:hypothetical protein